MRMITWIYRNSPVRYEMLHRAFHGVPQYRTLNFEDIVRFLVLEGLITYTSAQNGTFISSTIETEDESK